ncbi:hypothetical protein HF325_004926 [Metschnikowia pulcherrima]|uniref:Niemann-Pick C1 N-terminal domain-containing protein n=1 Tax=Metschnikowia pulcherrima TaxID=27326 RepID=A0A8H7LDK4_9ASCO|nr:hypothetical protein HF325_004926 [Metschnikowia pulcherrima]
MLLIALVAALALLSLSGADSPIRKEGYCSTYGNCGKKSIFGSLLPCVNNTKAVVPLPESVDILTRDFFCKFACSPDQSTFTEITETQSAIDTHLEIVSEMSLYTHPDTAAAFYESCKNIKFSATNGYAMDLIGGGATNYSQFLKFLGDEKPLLGGSPFQIESQIHSA